jgi:anti-sigma regulatory factor (Ser/Thr protein kinase)
MTVPSQPGALRVEVELSRQPRAAALARRSVQETLGRWRVQPAQIEDAQLVASELVANALRYGRQPLALGLALTGNAVTVSVADRSEAPPRLHHRALLDERGRGLHIVASLAQTWGVRPVAGGGKRVWARLPAGERYA